jgi:hypothetical protein
MSYPLLHHLQDPPSSPSKLPNCVLKRGWEQQESQVNDAGTLLALSLRTKSIAKDGKDQNAHDAEDRAAASYRDSQLSVSFLHSMHVDHMLSNSPRPTGTSGLVAILRRMSMTGVEMEESD